MATYKVIQDIEAEDKFLGPLTLKQFIFGASALFFGYLSVFAITKEAAFLVAIFGPFALLGAFLAIPWSSDQPTEVWVLAKLRFKLTPKSRIWDQAGLEELVTITVPKKIEKQLTNGLSQDEVQSRLKALAQTIDTRGWAVKNATLEDHFRTNYPQPQIAERLIDPASMPKPVPEIDINQYADVLDGDNAVSENFQSMIQTSSQTHRQQSLDKMERVRHGEAVETPAIPEVQFTPPTELYANSADEDERLLSQQLRNKHNAGDANGHMRRFTASVSPTPQPQPASTVTTDDQADLSQNFDPAQQPLAEMTKTTDPAILNLAQNNDLNVATIARQAKRNDPEENEVVISLR